MNVTFPSNLFTYNAPTRTFAAECSDLQVGRPDTITIVSTRTGVAVEFTYTGKLQEQEDYDGELVGWEYKSWAGYKIHLYND
jgi:hypothetical protein